MTFKLALVQMRVEGGRKAANLARASDRIGAAAALGAQIVLLPEALSLGWMHPSAVTEADAVPAGASCAALAAAARAHGVFVCAGLVERDGARIFNSAVLLAPSGDLLLHHRKINELGMAHACYAPGDRLGVAETPLGKIGVMICADGFAPGQAIGRALGLMGAQVILSPCAWAVPPDHDNTARPYGWLWRENWGPVARDFRLWIAGASNVG
ncbi:MAG: carbon-nitrogen hydrolase family protein, partial [Opitutaceae bacterium]|nr:carbon-nitrogen hydrolase family protein [Opitutaceae bacterium]